MKPRTSVAAANCLATSLVRGALVCAMAALSNCNGCKSSGTLGSSSGEPQVQSSPGVTSSSPAAATVDFGVVPLGQTRTLNFMLANTGIASLTIQHIVVTTSDPEFTLDLAEGTQVGGTPITVPTHFTPFSSGAKTAVITLQTDSSDVPTVTLTLQGTGVKLDVQVVPEALDFGSVVIHTDASLPITLTNASTAPVTLTLSSVQGSDAALFTLGTLSSATLNAGQSETLTVSYAPVQVTSAPSTAFFNLTECDGCTALPISLRGEPVDTGLSITPNPLDFGFFPLGGSLTKTILLSNVANRPIDMTTNPTLDTGHPAAAFALGSGAPGFPFTLAPGTTQAVPVVFTPPQLGPYTGTITFFSDDPQAGQVAVPLTGTGGGPQIQCLPATLSFGQVAIGSPVTQQVLCTNAGQDVPGNPSATLQIGALTVPDDAAFKAHFDSPPPSGGLTSGQSVLIDVVYAPTAAQSDMGHLHIASNDSQTPDEVVPLSGSAISLPPCDSVVLPQGGLVFGEVQSGQSLQLPFAVQNQGTGDCLVAGLSLSATSSPAFTLPGGPIASQILGYPGNAQGTPTQLVVPVKFSPQQAGSFAGNVSFTISNPTAPQITVPLSGESGPSCLIVEPSSIDFGSVSLNPATNAWCTSLKRNVQLINTCNYDLQATEISIGTGTGTTPEFVISGLPALPATITAGTAIAIQVAFQPDSAGEKYGTVSAMLQQNPQGPYLVPLSGDAEPDGQETDTFNVQTSQPQVDLLIIMDNDDDGQNGLYSTVVAPVMPQLFQAAQQANIDYQIAVTDDDICSNQGSDQGHFEPCANCAYQTNPADMGSTQTIFTSQNPQQAQTDVIGLVPHPTWFCGEPDEQYFDAMYLALNTTGPNAGFLRPNAFLAVLQIDDDGEDDNNGGGPGVLGTVQAYYNFLIGLKGDPSLVSYSFLYDNSGLGAGSYVTSLVSDTIAGGGGGVIADVSCTPTNPCPVGPDQSAPDWVSALTSLWSSVAAAAYRYPLNGVPVASTIQVTLDGVPYPATGSHGNAQWSYNSTTNAVVFNPLAAPQAGDTVAITYTVACN